MKADKIYYYEYDKIGKFWMLFFWVGSVALTAIGFTKTFGGNDIRFFFIIVGLLIFSSSLIVWLVINKYYFRRHVILTDKGIFFKNKSLGGLLKVSWKDVSEIDLRLFEPRISIRGRKTIITNMDFEQNKKFRSDLMNAAEKHNLSLLK